MAAAPSTSALRMQPVTARNREIRILFEMEKAFILTGSTLIPRLGEPQLKYRLAEHIWEAAQHAKLLLERGRELPGFGQGEHIRESLWMLFDEAIRPGADVNESAGWENFAAMYRVLKPAMLAAYQDYLVRTEHLGDWPTTKLIEDFIRDEERHTREMAAWLESVPAAEFEASLSAPIASGPGLLAELDAAEIGAQLKRIHLAPYRHPSLCRREPYPVCGNTFGDDPAEYTILPQILADPLTDPHLIRLIIYTWLFNELDAVDYLSTVLYEMPGIGFEAIHDITRHLWDEARHSHFGYRALPRLGVDLTRLEQQIGLYATLVKFNPAERYALMTQHFEAGSFEIKALIMDRVRELGDFEADTLLAFDRNDEQHHVRYGTRHLPAMLKYFDLEVEDIKAWLPTLGARFGHEVTADNARIGHSLPAGQRLSGHDLIQLAMSGTSGPLT